MTPSWVSVHTNTAPLGQAFPREAVIPKDSSSVQVVFNSSVKLDAGISAQKCVEMFSSIICISICISQDTTSPEMIASDEELTGLLPELLEAELLLTFGLLGCVKLEDEKACEDMFNPGADDELRGLSACTEELLSVDEAEALSNKLQAVSPRDAIADRVATTNDRERLIFSLCTLIPSYLSYEWKNNTRTVDCNNYNALKALSGLLIKESTSRDCLAYRLEPFVPSQVQIVNRLGVGRRIVA